MTHWLWLGAVAHAAPEWCNGVDDDGDGDVDEAPLTRYTLDADGDGFGDPSAVAATPSCAVTVGFWDEPDCDDADPDAAPGLSEDADYDGVDDDCNGLVDDLPAPPVNTVPVWDADSTFVFADLDDPFDASETWCRDRGYELTSIHDAVENQLVKDTIGAGGFSTDRFWIGYRRPNESSPFAWRDGTPDDFEDLNSLSGGPRNCVLVDQGQDEWQNAKCGDPHGSVCELACTVRTRYADADQDGFGDPSAPTSACAGLGFADNDDDCNDADPNDNLRLWYADADHDGAGDPDTAFWSCSALPDTVDNADDCDDGDDAVDSTTPWFADLDGDGYGAGQVSVGCDPVADTVLTGGDCDDDDGDAHPGAPEVCDPYDHDEDCDGEGDELDAVGPFDTYWPDADGDGYGDPSGPSIEACDPLDQYVLDASDCIDTDSDVHPGAVEQCNGLDDDCDPTTPDAVDEVPWWPDADGDGWGDADATPIESCSEPTDAHVPVGGDCDDTSADVHPTADDPPADGVDQDCDGEDGASTPPTGDTGAPPPVDGDPAPDRPASGGPSATVGCGCDGAPAVGGWFAAAAAGLSLVRRRR